LSSYSDSLHLTTLLPADTHGPFSSGSIAITQLLDVLDQISGFIWGPFFLIPLLLGVGLYLTIRLGGLQFFKLIPALKLGILKRKDPGSKGYISQFQAL